MKKLEKGFTLIELMIVVAIIAILAAVAAPKFGVQMQKASDAKGLAIIGALRSAAQMAVADNHDTASAATPTYGALELAIDTKSRVLVSPSADGTTALVKVGKNSVTEATTGYAKAAAATWSNSVKIDDPDNEGLILITSTGKDAKEKSWSDY